MLTTEHYNLQGARSATVSEANGRAGLYLSSISGVLVALGFVGQASKMGDTFYLFGLVLLPSLFFLGLVTFSRLLETSVEDYLYAMGINRIRHFYMEQMPDMHQYFILKGNDDGITVLNNMGVFSMRGQTLLSTSGLIGVINSVIGGVFAGLVISALFQASVVICGLVGLVVFGTSVVSHQYVSGQRWRDFSRHVPAVFPGPQADTKNIKPD